MTCPNCQTENPPGSRFCMECGTRLPPSERRAAVDAAATTAAIPRDTQEASTLPRAPISAPPSAVSAPSVPVSRPLDPTDLPPTHPEWRMSPAGPLPDQPRRRWLVWLLAAVGACILLCVVVFLWANTIGTETLNALGTQVANEATRQAEGQGQ